MSTALTNTANNAVGAATDNPFGEGTEGVGSTTYVKFTGATGMFTAGQNDDEIDHGTRFVADIFNSQWVWSFWWDSEVMESFTDLLRDVPLSFDNPPMELPEDPEGKIDMTIEEIMQAQKDDPANFRDGWSVQASFNMRPLDGSDEEFTLKLNKGVAMNAFHALRKSYSRLYKLKAGLLPVVEISANSYVPKAKSAGKKRYAPVIKIVDWISEADLIAAQGDDPADYDDPQDEAPKTIAETPQDKAETPADTPADAAPSRGRRGARAANLG